MTGSCTRFTVVNEKAGNFLKCIVQVDLDRCTLCTIKRHKLVRSCNKFTKSLDFVGRNYRIDTVYPLIYDIDGKLNKLNRAEQGMR